MPSQSNKTKNTKDYKEYPLVTLILDKITEITQQIESHKFPFKKIKKNIQDLLLWTDIVVKTSDVIAFDEIRELLSEPAFRFILKIYQAYKNDFDQEANHLVCQVVLALTDFFKASILPNEDKLITEAISIFGNLFNKASDTTVKARIAIKAFGRMADIDTRFKEIIHKNFFKKFTQLREKVNNLNIKAELSFLLWKINGEDQRPSFRFDVLSDPNPYVVSSALDTCSYEEYDIATILEHNVIKKLCTKVQEELFSWPKLADKCLKQLIKFAEKSSSFRVMMLNNTKFLSTLITLGMNNITEKTLVFELFQELIRDKSATNTACLFIQLLKNPTFRELSEKIKSALCVGLENMAPATQTNNAIFIFELLSNIHVNGANSYNLRNEALSVLVDLLDRDSGTSSININDTSDSIQKTNIKKFIQTLVEYPLLDGAATAHQTTELKLTLVLLNKLIKYSGEHIIKLVNAELLAQTQWTKSIANLYNIGDDQVKTQVDRLFEQLNRSSIQSEKTVTVFNMHATPNSESNQKLHSCHTAKASPVCVN